MNVEQVDSTVRICPDKGICSHISNFAAHSEASEQINPERWGTFPFIAQWGTLHWGFTARELNYSATVLWTWLMKFYFEQQHDLLYLWSDWLIICHWYFQFLSVLSHIFIHIWGIQKICCFLEICKLGLQSLICQKVVNLVSCCLIYRSWNNYSVYNKYLIKSVISSCSLKWPCRRK